MTAELFKLPNVAAPTLARAKELSAARIEKVVAKIDPTHTVLMVSGGRDSYLALRETPINPVAIQLCRSGECMCGTSQSKQSRGEAAAIYPEWGAWLDDLEKRARAKHGWGWGEPMPKPADPRQGDMFSPMCVGCARDDQRDAA